MKLLYDIQAETLLPYPRSDDAPVVGLDPRYAILRLLQDEQPTYDPQTQRLDSIQVIDLEAGEVRRGWMIVNFPPAGKVPDWKTFKRTLLSDAEINALLGGGIPYVPAAALALPATVINSSEGGDLADFRAAWLALRRAGLVSYQLLQKVRVLAIQCNMTEEFLSSIGGTVRPSPQFVGQEWISSDGVLWVVVQAREENGQFVSDDPNTPEKESLEWKIAD
jgi:hypothetical protein